MILAGTGHRPDKLGGYGVDTRLVLASFARELLLTLQPAMVISGMAQGWDLALAGAAIRAGIPLVAAIPFEGQESVWPDDAQATYRRLLAEATVLQVVSPGGYAAWKMQARNEWMVDMCTVVAALWNGSPGGTANCVAYARRVKRPVMDLWPKWRNRGPQVLNKHTATLEEQARAVNIMRPSKWGNPFKIGDGYGRVRSMTREQVIKQHEDWLLGSDVGRALLADIGELRGHDLLCCCAPKPCHGDLLLRLANA